MKRNKFLIKILKIIFTAFILASIGTIVIILKGCIDEYIFSL